MKKKIILFILAACLLLGGCGVSQNDYNDLQGKYDTLQSEYDDLQSKYNDIKENYDKMVDDKAQKAEEEMTLAYPKAWATTYFGDNCLMMFSDNNEYLQIVSQKEYNATSDSVKDIYKTVLSSMQGLGTYINEINQDRIAIKFEQTGGKAYLEFVFKRENGSYTLESTNGDLQNVTTLIQGLSGVSK